MGYHVVSSYLAFVMNDTANIHAPEILSLSDENLNLCNFMRYGISRLLFTNFKTEYKEELLRGHFLWSKACIDKLYNNFKSGISSLVKN